MKTSLSKTCSDCQKVKISFFWNDNRTGVQSGDTIISYKSLSQDVANAVDYVHNDVSYTKWFQIVSRYCQAFHLNGEKICPFCHRCCLCLAIACFAVKFTNFDTLPYRINIILQNQCNLKAEVLKNIDKYIVKDPRTTLLLHQLHTSGAKTFLLTNSDYAYTNVCVWIFYSPQAVGLF